MTAQTGLQISVIGASEPVTIECSTNLTQWTQLTTIQAKNGACFYLDLTATDSPKRFYRAWVGSTGNTNAPASMALIPAGSFTMGDAFSEGFIGELPTHTVAVSAFYMDKTEVTKALWDEVQTWATAHSYSFDHAGSGKAANHPVHTVSWYDAVKWCNARSEKEGRVPAYYLDAAQTTVYRTGQVNVQNAGVKWNAGYRLPTEAEWEKAARGGVSGHRFPWSDVDTISHSQANYYCDRFYAYDVSPTGGFHPSYYSADSPCTSPVGSFAANGYGLYDMAGNMFEWCWDWYQPYSSGTQTDPHGPTLGAGRVDRGGSWGGNALLCRVAFRDFADPNLAEIDFGFRSVLPLDY